MNNFEQQLDCAKKLIEQRIGKAITGIHDFELLKAFISTQTNQSLSISTLKRIWSYKDGAIRPRENSLDILSQCIGYRNWIDFETNHCNNDTESSAVSFAYHLAPADLDLYEVIEIAWHPERRLYIQYCGEDLFKVLKSENAKLKESNTFHCSMFVLNEPLTITNLQQGVRTIDLFQLGKRGGLTEIKRHLEKK